MGEAQRRRKYTQNYGKPLIYQARLEFTKDEEAWIDSFVQTTGIDRQSSK